MLTDLATMYNVQHKLADLRSAKLLRVRELFVIFSFTIYIYIYIYDPIHAYPKAKYATLHMHKKLSVSLQL